MALSAGPVIIPGKGTVFIGPPNAAPLVKDTLDPSLPATYVGWECLGHTSRDNAVALSKEGGDATNLGSWWDPNLVSNRDAVTWGYTVNSLQIDYLTLSLAFPNGRKSGNLFVVPSQGGSIERAIYILCIDGTKRLGIYGPRSSISLGEAPSISTDSFFEIQLSGSMLSATEVAGSDIAVGDLIAFDPPVALVVPVPVVATATPPTAAVGTPMTINGSYFTGATSVKFGAVAMASPVINATGTQITGLMPAGSAGAAPVTVVTPAGTSNALTYTRGA